MDPAFITPFIASIKNVFSTMLQLPVTIGTPALKADPSPTHEVSGIIGMSGAVVGTVVLSFERHGAERLVELFAGERFDADSADFADAVGELVNMVSGGAKAKFTAGEVSISCPSVVVGPGHKIAVPSDTPVVCIPCRTDCGSVVIEVAIKPVAAGVARQSA